MAATSLPGYTVVKKASQQMAERYAEGPASFEVLDLKTFQRTEIDNTPKPATKKKRAKKVPEQVQPQLSIAEEIEEITEPEVEEVIQPRQFNHSVNFITPYTETEIFASEVYVDKTVFSLITPQTDRIKIRPKRGSKLSATYNGETHELYASGVYIPINSLDSVLSIFFVMDETSEEG